MGKPDKELREQIFGRGIQATAQGVRSVLKSYQTHSRILSDLEEELREVRLSISAKMNAGKSLDVDGQPRGTVIGNPTAQTVELLEHERNLERHILALIERHTEQTNVALKLLFYVGGLHEELIRRFYVSGEKIPPAYDTKSHLSRRRIQQILAEGIDRIVDSLNAE